MLPVQFLIVMLIGPGLGTLGAVLGLRVTRRQEGRRIGGRPLVPPPATDRYGRRIHAFTVGVWTEVDWYYVGVTALFLAALLVTAITQLRVMHGMRDHDEWVWFWLVCTFALSVNVVIWAVARIAALLGVIRTMREEGEQLLNTGRG